MKIYKVILALLVFLSIVINCKTVHSPDKIAHLASLNTQADGTRVEVTVWVKDVIGDEKLGFELITGENKDNYPLAIFVLKDGQRAPSKEQNICLRGEILKRDEIAGGIVYRIKNGEIIECY